MECARTDAGYRGAVSKDEDNTTGDVASARVIAGVRPSVFRRMDRSSGGVVAVIQTIVGIAFLVLFVAIVIQVIW
ncbi:MAG: hypothetical protein V7636_181 [Actinomycetota bacterium]